MSLLLTLGLGGSGTPPTPPSGGDTPYMNLLLPTVSVTLGPLYATEVNQAFLRVDAHDHTSGYGKPVPSGGLNINADVPFNNFQLLNLKAAQFAIQSPTVGPTGSLYFSGQDLWALDGTGFPIQITAGGSVNIGGIGGWSGLTAPATAKYSSVAKTFYLQTDTAGPKYGTFAIGDIHLFSADPSTSGVYTALVNGAASTYSLITPAGLPANPNKQLLLVDYNGNMSYGPGTMPTANPAFLRMTPTGTVSGDVDVDGSTIVITGSGTSKLIGIKVLGVTNPYIAGATISPDKLALSGHTQSTAIPLSINTTSTPSVIGSVTLTVSGLRPVQISMHTTVAAGSQPGFVATDTVVGGGQAGFVDLRQDSVVVNSHYIPVQVAGIDSVAPTNCLACVLPPPAAGARTYDVRIWTNSSTGGQIFTNGFTLTAQEI